MKRVGVFSAALAAVVGTCSAATYTWTGAGGDGKFSTAANWGVESVAFPGNDTCVFNTGDALAVTLDSAVTVGTVTFSGAGAVTVGGDATLTVTKVTSGADAGAPTFTCPVAFSGGYLVDFATAAATFAGGATATKPDAATTDNEASHALRGEIHFTEDWTAGKYAYSYTVPNGSKVYGKLFTGTSTDGTSGTNGSGIALVIQQGGYAEFDKVISANKACRVAVKGYLKVNGIYQVGTEGLTENSHVGFDGDESGSGVIEAGGVLKYSNYNCYVKVPTFYIGAQGFGAMVKDYTLHLDGCDKTIYATDNFEIMGPVNTGNLNDWGLTLDKAMTLDTQGYTVTWTGGASGGGALIKTGAGTLIMKPNGCNFSSAATVKGGKLVIANIKGLGSVAINLVSDTANAASTLEMDSPDKQTIANAVTAADGTALAFNLKNGELQGRLGKLVPPASGTVNVTVSGAPGALGTVYTLTSGAFLSQGDLARFQLQDRDDLSLGLSSAGELILTVTSSDVVPTVFTYAAETADEAVWSATIAAWTLAGDAAKVAFTAGGDALFSGSIPAEAQSVSIPGAIAVGNITMDTASDITLTGTGTLTGQGTITKTGTGTLTLNGASLDAQNLVITGGKVVLGADASENSLGTDSATSGGTVTVGPGSQFNLNYIGENTDSGNNSSARAEITQHKIFVIEGNGPDGRGAIVNDALDGRETHNSAWNAAFRRIVLAGDATIGGIDRFDVRNRSGTAATAAGGVFGPGKKLTVKNTGYFGVVSLPLDVGSVLVTEGGIFRPESATVTVPGGITLDNGTLHAYSTTYPATVPIYAKGTGGAISGQSGTTTFNGPVIIDEGATLTMENGATQDYVGGVTNNGTVKVTGGTHNFTGGSLGGNGTWEQTGGSFFWYQTLDLAEPRTVNLSGGTFFYGKETAGSGKLNKKLTVDATGGTFAFNLGASETITSDDLAITGSPADLRFYAKNDRSVKVRLENIELNGFTGALRLGDSASPVDYTLGDGAHITAANFYHANADNIPYCLLTLKEGSSLTVPGAFKIGDGTGTGEYGLIVDGGTVTQTGTTRLLVGRETDTAYVDLKSGTMNLYGIQCREAWKGPKGDPGSYTYYSETFRMDGGTLNIGAGGLCAWTHFDPFVNFNNGTVNCTANWVVEQLRAVGFGDRPYGHVDFNIGDKTIDWRTGIIGGADVTLKGTGTFKSGIGVKDYMRFQGAATGAWTIENSGVNDLYGASAFLGGLHLKENVSANIRIGGSNLVEAVYLQTGSGQFENACTWSNAYPFVCNDLTLLHAKGEASDYSNAILMWQGQFYADTAGTWTFGGGYDDAIRVDVDGEKVMEHATWNTVNKGTVDLTVGWHDFRIVQYQAGGGWGTVPSGWANVMNVGFAKTAVENTDAANYTKFDADHLPIRAPVRTTAGGTVNWRGVHQKTDWNTRTDWTFVAVTNKLSMLDIYNVALPETLGNSVHMFDGWVYVPEERAGDWAVHLDFDDWASLKLGGVDSGATGANNAAGHAGAIEGVTAGWHWFELRVCDTGGNWGPWSGTTGQAKNPLATVTVNGVTYKFDETQFRFSNLPPVAYAGLDGTVCLDAGSRLTNTAASACPIWGTLAGTGTLSGPFAFAGEANVLQVTGTGRTRAMTGVQFENAYASTFAGLRTVKAVFDGEPVEMLYDLGPAMGADPEAIALDVKDASGTDYSAKFAPIVFNGHLFLRNGKLAGMMLTIK